MAEYRVSIYGRNPDEWAKLADWFQVHKEYDLYDPYDLYDMYDLTLALKIQLEPLL